ncbi:hypothetical protein MKX01_011353 [Papaver californicum]|nr:hypothetical protein MKX01_011353 [Papaver californicum]
MSSQYLMFVVIICGSRRNMDDSPQPPATKKSRGVVNLNLLTKLEKCEKVPQEFCQYEPTGPNTSKISAYCGKLIKKKKLNSMCIYWRSPKFNVRMLKVNGKASRKHLFMPHRPGTKSFVNHAIEWVSSSNVVQNNEENTTL